MNRPESVLSDAVKKALGGADADLPTEPTHPEANPSIQTFAYPEDALLRLNQIIGDPKANPPVPPIISIKKSCWWEGTRTGRFPKPVYLPGGRAAFWRVKDIRALVESAK